MLEWIKSKLGISQLELKIAAMKLENSGQHALLQNYVDSKVNEFTEATRVDADLCGHRGNCTIILTGVYNNRGYVQFYDVPHKEFEYYVERLKDMRKHNLIRNIDSPFPHAKAFFGIR